MRVETLQRPSRMHCCWNAQLSVPSMRVETLQLVVAVFGETRSDLSVPSMRVETLQRPSRKSGRLQCASFSTLHAGRDAATSEAAQVKFGAVHFQYPPCGSRRCNQSVFKVTQALPHLSVPSMRVETLQPQVLH